MARNEDTCLVKRRCVELHLLVSVVIFTSQEHPLAFILNIYLWWTKDQLFMSWGGRGGVTSGNIGYSGAAGVWKTSLIHIFPQHDNNTHSYIQSTKSYTHLYIIQLLVAILYIRLKSKINKHRPITQFIMLNYKIFIEEFV